MFHSDLDSLELGGGSAFAPSDLLLFPDDLLNVPIESLASASANPITNSDVVMTGEKTKPAIVGGSNSDVSFFIQRDEDEEFVPTNNYGAASSPSGHREQDLLEQVINEIKMTPDFDMSGEGLIFFIIIIH